jgi:hypothetical protein
MHRYNTRFAAMNRSFAPAVFEESDDEYVPSLGSWSAASGRRPVTRSMTAARSARSVPTAPPASAPVYQSTRTHSMVLRSSRR